MISRTELEIEYAKDEMKPVSASCRACREKMLTPPSDLVNSAEIITWLSMVYLVWSATQMVIY